MMARRAKQDVQPVLYTGRLYVPHFTDVPHAVVIKYHMLQWNRALQVALSISTLNKALNLLQLSFPLLYAKLDFHLLPDLY